MKWFGKKKKKELSDIEVPTYTIEIIALEKIPQLNLEYLEVNTFDLSVTQIRVPALTEIVEDENGVEKKRQYPEVIFNLKAPSKDSQSDRESISLNDALLSNYHIVSRKAIILDGECQTTESLGQKYYTRLVYDLFVFTRESLVKANLSWEEYNKEKENLRKRHLQEKAELEKNYSERLASMEQPYLEKEKKSNETLKKLNSEIYNLLVELPGQRNSALMEAIKKMNPLHL